MRARKPTTRGVIACLGCLPLVTVAGARSWAEEADYNSRVYGGSAYVQHGPGPAYGGAYSDYGRNATGIEGRFSASYGEYEAYPGYGRFGGGSSFGSGSLRGAGTGWGEGGNGRRSFSRKSPASASKPKKPGAQLPF